jgi:amino-acid N-acetyltransferase
MGIGPKMVSYLIDEAKKENLKSVFVLTTQTSDWFEKLGFIPDDIETLPEQRKQLWTKKRNSKLFRLNLN